MFESVLNHLGICISELDTAHQIVSRILNSESTIFSPICTATNSFLIQEYLTNLEYQTYWILITLHQEVNEPINFKFC